MSFVHNENEKKIFFPPRKKLNAEILEFVVGRFYTDNKKIIFHLTSDTSDNEDARGMLNFLLLLIAKRNGGEQKIK